MSGLDAHPYYYAVNGKTHGPFTAAEMKGHYENCVIFPDTNIWSKGMSGWLLLNQTPLLKYVAPEFQVQESPPKPSEPPSPKPVATKRLSSKRTSERQASTSSAAQLSPKSTERGKVTSITELRRASRKLSRRNPSQCFIEAIEKGSLIWVEDPEVVWKLCEVLSQAGSVLQVEVVESKERISVDTNFQETHHHNPHVVPDMTSLHHLHEASILYNLGVRSAEFLPYTYMGPVLIAVNPLRNIPMPDMSIYEDAATRQAMAPHPYAIAATCVNQLNSGAGVNQSVVISGESGAGKTETAKILLDYLVKRSNHYSGKIDEGTALDARLLQSSAILESFGNALTSKNSNSSRFGKFMKIYFARPAKKGAVGKLMGAAIDTYLLEKSRVASQIIGERNYHIFYQLVEACRLAEDYSTNEFVALIPEDVQIALSVGKDEFSILNNPFDTDFVDHANFLATSEALVTMGVPKGTVSELWTALCGVLLLGNAAIEECDSPEGPVAVVQDPAVCAAAAYFLGIDENELSRLLTERTMSTRGELFTIRLRRQDAAFARDAVCKQIYEGLFILLVKLMNSGLTNDEIIADSTFSYLRYIGVLDVFGFESFERNEFEQLLINFANESLQETFNVQVFQAELRLFETENISCSVSSCPDNKECVEMIAGKPSGIFSLLDNICKLPKPSDEKFCEELHLTLNKHRYFPQTHPKDKKNTFWIKHYAGAVKYSVWDSESMSELRGVGEMNQWVSKNNDSIPDGVLPLLRSSTYSTVRMLYPDTSLAPVLSKGESFVNYKWGGDFSGSRQRDNMRNLSTKTTKMTIASSFARSMSELNAVLLSTQCSFIRCIKPNAKMQLGIFDNSFVVGQIRSLGLVQACEVLRVGLPHRISYLDLKEAVSYIMEEALEIFKGESEDVFIASLFYGFEVPPEAYRLGRTRAFFRTGQLAALEGMLSDGAELRRDTIIARLHEALEIRKEARALAENCRTQLINAEKSLNDALKSYELIENASSEPSSGVSLSMAHIQAANYQYSVYRRFVGDIKEVFDATHRGGVDINPNEKTVDAEALRIATIPGKPEINEELLKLAKACCHALETAETTYDIVSNDMEKMLAADKAAVENAEMHTIVSEMWDHIMRLESLVETARLRAREAEDGALRCQIAYTAERSELCGAVLTTIDIVITEMEKLTTRAHTIIAGDYEGHRKTQLLADKIVATCIKESHEVKKVFSMCNELLKAKETALNIFRQETMQIEEDEKDIESFKNMHIDVAPSEKNSEVASKSTTGGKSRGKYAALSSIRKKLANQNTQQQKTTDTVKQELVVEEEMPPELEPLPEGWAEYRDDERDLPYYYNLYTQETQWERPTIAAFPLEVKAAEVLPRSSDDHHGDAASERSEEEEIHMLDDVYVLPKPDGFGRSGSMRLSTRITTDEFERLGLTTKFGTLMKRSKYLRLWKKRFVVVEDSKLMYFKKSQDYNSGVRHSDKTMTLTPESMTSFTTVKNCFSVKQRDPLSTGVGDATGSRIRRSLTRKNLKSEQWFLMAKDDLELHEWVTSISAHIHVVHMLSASYEKTKADYLAMGTSDTSFWCVPLGLPGAQKLPIGIRTIPEFSGPRTGEGLYPGEIFEVVHRFDIYDNDRNVTNSFLKLGDDRGWIFERHPKSGVHLINQVICDFDSVKRHFRYTSDQELGLDIVFGPGPDSRKTGQTIQPGEDITVCGTFKHLMGITLVEYYHLKDGRGWVPRLGSKGQELFQKSVENPLFAARR